MYLNKIILGGIIIGAIIIGLIAVSGMSDNIQEIQSDEDNIQEIQSDEEKIELVVETPPQESKQLSLDLNERVVLGDR